MKKLVMILAVVIMVLGVSVISYAKEKGGLGTRIGYREAIEYIESDGDTVVDHGTYADVHSNQYGVDFILLRDGTLMYEHPDNAGTNMEYTFHTMWKHTDGTVWMHAYNMDTELISVLRIY